MVQSASKKGYKISYCVQIFWFCILKDKNFLWTCSFSATNMTNFVSLSLKLHNQYCNSACQLSRQITIVFLFSFILLFSVLCPQKKTSSMRQRSNEKPSISSFMSNLCNWQYCNNYRLPIFLSNQNWIFFLFFFHFTFQCSVSAK